MPWERGKTSREEEEWRRDEGKRVEKNCRRDEGERVENKRNGVGMRRKGE